MAKRTLTARLATWIALTFVVSMALFAVVVYFVAAYEERDEEPRKVGESSEEIGDDVEEEVVIALAAAAPVGLLLAVGGAIWIARRSVAPVRDIIRAATDITADRLEQRLPVPRGDDEVRDLVVALNKLLGRLEDGFLAQGAFAADASHELRTPLAVIATGLEVALRQPRSSDEWAAAARGALGEVGRLSRLVDGLLQLRRAQIGAPGRAASADLGVVLEDVAARAAGAANAAGVRLDLPAPLPAQAVVGRPEELALAIGNVVANAVRASPSGGSVRLGVAEARGEVALHVDDDGPGVATGDEERIFAPFTRGRRDGPAQDGFGLGLAIARRIVDNAGGSLVCSRPASGGARFTFVFAVHGGIPVENVGG